MINVTERISELMNLKGWTPYELSNQTGISRTQFTIGLR